MKLLQNLLHVPRTADIKAAMNHQKGHNGTPTQSRSRENVVKDHKIVTSNQCVMIGRIENKSASHMDGFTAF
jgi:hypothetical protein